MKSDLIPPCLQPSRSPDDEECGDDAMLSLGCASVWLAGITVLVAACSEALTGSIEEVSHSWGLSQSFLGCVHVLYVRA